MRGVRSKRAAYRASSALAVVLVAAGCSLIVNRASSQCETSADCARFANGSTCEEGVCAAPSGLDGASDALSDTSLLGDVPLLPCVSTQDCSPQGVGWICRKGDGVCVQVTSPDCPDIPVGQYTSDDVILLGALLPLPTDVTYGHLGASIDNAIRLAATDFGAGLPPLADGGNPRPLAVLFCDEVQNLGAAVRHLRDDLRVPVIFGTAFSATTIQAAQQIEDGGVDGATIPPLQLLFSPAAGSDLSSVRTDAGLVWRSIASDSYQAAAIDATLSFIEATLNAADGGSPDGGGAPLRIAIIHQADVAGDELDTRVTANLRYNGALASDQIDAGNFIDTDYGNPDGPPPPEGQPQAYTNAIDAVTSADALPDVVILLGYTHAITSVLAGVESFWPTTLKPRPRYVVSNGLETSDLLARVANDADLRGRILGTSPGENPLSDSTTKNFYTSYAQSYPIDGGTSPASYATANAYDAFYTVAYALSATRNSDVVGLDVVNALRKILTPGSLPLVPIAVGSNGILSALAAIQAGMPIALTGASGPLTFDLATGDVASDVQVWCIAQGGGGPAFQASGLFYAAAQDGGALQGTYQSCGN